MDGNFYSKEDEKSEQNWAYQILGRVRLGYSGIRIYSGMYSRIYSGYSAPGSRIAGMEIQVFQNKNSSQTNAYSHYSNYSYSGLIPNEHALKFPVFEHPFKGVLTEIPNGTYNRSVFGSVDSSNTKRGFQLKSPELRHVY